MWSFDPDAVRWHLVEDEVMALDTARGEYFAVNGSGALLWPHLAAGTTEQTLAERLVTAYGIDPEVAAGDVARFMGALRERNLLVQGV